jgi:hypothetical protein
MEETLWKSGTNQTVIISTKSPLLGKPKSLFDCIDNNAGSRPESVQWVVAGNKPMDASAHDAIRAWSISD